MLVQTFRIEKCYLFFALLFGLVFLFLTPPFQVADEPAHFYRAFQVSETGWVARKSETGTVGGMLPRTLSETVTKTMGKIAFRPDQTIRLSTIVAQLKRPLDAADRVVIYFPNTALYSPVSYLPQALGIRLMRFFPSVSPLMLLYAARICNLVACISLCYWAIKITSIGKWAFFLLALAPMTVFQAASASGDAIVMGLAFLAAAWFLRTLEQTRPMRVRELAFLVALAAALALVKPPYAILVALFIAVPSSKFSSKRHQYLFITILLLVTGSLVTGWALIAHSLYVPAQPDAHVDPAGQLHYMLGNPFHYLRAVLVTHGTTASDGLLIQFVGVLGWLDTPIPLWSVVLYYSLFLLALFPQQRTVLPSCPHRWFALSLWIVAFEAVDVLLYLTWTKIGDTRIQGLQGRYYLPLAPLLIIAGYGLVTTEQKPITRRCMFVTGILVVLTTSVIISLFRYYPVSCSHSGCV
jgi:uncharacterized membrane protein